MLIDATNIINYLVQALIISLFFSLLLEPRWNKYLCFVIMFIVQSANTMIGGFVFFYSPFRIEAVITVTFITICVLYKGKLPKKLLYFALNMFMTVLTECLCMLFTVNILHIDPDDSLLVNRTTTVVIALIILTIMFSIALIIIKRNSLNLTYKELMIYSIPLILETTLVIFIIDYAYKHQNSSLVLVFILNILITVLSCVYFLYMLITINRKSRLELENSYLQNQIQLQYSSYSELKAQIQQTSMFRHDIYNHIQAIRQIVQTGESDKAEEYFNLLQERFDSIDVKINSGSPVIDAIFKFKYPSILNNSISIYTDFRITEEIPIQEIDLVSLFTNMLDNAIEAASLSEEKQISVECYTKCSTLVIKLKNSCTAQEKKVKKDESYIHGLGQKIMYEICKKYSGSFDCKLEGNTFISNACIMLDK